MRCRGTRWSAGAATAAVLLLAVAPAIGAPAGVELTAVPRAECGPGSRPEPAQQGRVPGWDDSFWRDRQPYTCNTELLAHHNTTGGYKVLRYVGAAGRECAYYDSTLVAPLDAATQAEEGAGVIVLDMTDPSRPVQTATLTTPAMLSPHESLVLSSERGLLAAAMGNPTTYPAVVDVYDLTADCTHPQLVSSTPVGLFGHESGFAPDGRTLYVSSLFTRTVTAIDLDDPRVPTPLWVAPLSSHGMTVSDDGTRLYLTPLETTDSPFYGGTFDSGIAIVDVASTVQRRPGAAPRVISALTWPEASVAQTAIPVTIGGTPYLIVVDEFTNPRDWDRPAQEGVPGVVHIVDISDETAPRVVSRIRLEVHDPALRLSDGMPDDPGADRFYQGYAAHYCAVPTRTDPGVLACSMILSGLRVFDIRDPLHPREVAYFNAPGNPGIPPVDPEGAPYAMSAPVVVPERREVWYSDASSGFYVVRVSERAWPAASAPTPPVGAAPELPEPAPSAPSSAPVLPATGGALAWALALVAAGVAARRALRPPR